MRQVSKKTDEPTMKSAPQSEGVRINRYLAQQGLATRREADELIARGRVLVNGAPAMLGQIVTDQDAVTLRGKTSGAVARRYIAYHKPRGVITHSPSAGERDIRESVPELTRKYGLFPIGRLDKDSSGLILLTNDGRVTDRVLNPDRDHEKEYVVRTKKKLRPSFKAHMEAGVDIEGYQTKPAKVRLMGDQQFAVTLSEGKKHQIRRMVVALHNEVETLTRTRIMNIKLGTLKSGEYRVIEGEELATFLSSLGLQDSREPLK